MRIIKAARELFDRIYIAYMRHKVLRSKLEDLTDHSLLDRALAGEAEAKR